MEIVVSVGAVLLIMCVVSYLEGRLSGNLAWEGVKTILLLIPFAGFGLGALIGNRVGFKETSWQIVAVAIIFQVAYYTVIALIISSLTST